MDENTIRDHVREEIFASFFEGGSVKVEDYTPTERRFLVDMMRYVREEAMKQVNAIHPDADAFEIIQDDTTDIYKLYVQASRDVAATVYRSATKVDPQISICIKEVATRLSELQPDKPLGDLMRIAAAIRSVFVLNPHLVQEYQTYGSSTSGYLYCLTIQRLPNEITTNDDYLNVIEPVIMDILNKVDPQISIDDLINHNEAIYDYYKQLGQQAADDLIESEKEKQKKKVNDAYDKAMKGLV